MKSDIKLIESSGLFDKDWYLSEYPDVRILKMDPIEHYLTIGSKLLRNPSRHFNSGSYLRDNPHAKGINPLLHFIKRKLPHVDQVRVEADTAAIETIFPIRWRKSVFCRKLVDVLSPALSLDIQEALRTSETSLAASLVQLVKHEYQPLVSIVMPTFNRAAIIGEAIGSVVEQMYQNWELLICDDGGGDDTAAIVDRLGDSRIRYFKQERCGAAAARNAALEHARGEIIAYLDSDNQWHPAFLARMVLALIEQPGCSSVYGNYIDYKIDKSGKVSIKSFVRPAFSQELLLEKNYIDLNSFVHRRELYDSFGGFNTSLTRRQDYDLILKYTWLRDPIQVNEILTLYQRNANFSQITTAARADDSCVTIINDSIAGYFKRGLPLNITRPVKKVTILSWDLCRNHFSKPFALAEALSVEYEVQLISFRFFEEEIFPPLRGVIPPFETIYLPGSSFPNFLDAIEKAVDAVRGDVIYVIKPRLPSLGVALLANYRSKVPIILEINDLETVVSSPKIKDRHKEFSLDNVDLSDRDLLNPYSDLWSQIMDPIAKSLPVLVTHNVNLDEHFGGQCLYMRNLKNEAVYDPARYEREAVRAELGFGTEDRIILFGGMIRKHKGIYELVELVQRLSDPRYKLLFVGSRPTPDQKHLMEKYGDQVHVLPPQDRETMARINLAADLVILWLDPEVPASRYQMPYKATDAFAMGPAIIANDISDLGILGKQGYLELVPFGDWKSMAATIRNVFDDSPHRERMRAASRRLFLRQFSYMAARGNFELAARRALKERDKCLPVSQTFARRFEEFRLKLTGEKEVGFFQATSEPSVETTSVNVALRPAQTISEDTSIELVDVANMNHLLWRNPTGVAVVMPSIDIPKARETARLLAKRAGMSTRIFIVEDTIRQGFIKTLNQIAARLNTRYVVYLAEDAFPGVNWLNLAYEKLERSGKGLLGFNDGKWHGRIASFGIVRKDWVKDIYGGDIFFSGYKSHRADNELTAIARATNQFIYLPDAVLMEIDIKKIFRSAENEASNFHNEDKRLFIRRYNESFSMPDIKYNLDLIRDEYLNQRTL
jgi:glycosyltransferase involved in cell wall biosynthesis